MLRSCRTLLLTLAQAAAIACVASAQAPAPAAAVMTAARLRQIGDSLAPAASRTAQLARGPGYTYAVTHRDSTGGLEVHDAWTDIFVVQSGSATFMSGGTVDGAKEATPGEWRGGSHRGGTASILRTGDVVVVPAGSPHQMLLAPGETISYLAFKVAAPPKP